MTYTTTRTSTVWVRWTGNDTASSTCSNTSTWSSWNTSSTTSTAAADDSTTTWCRWVNCDQYVQYTNIQQTEAEKQEEKDRLFRLAEERKEREKRAKAREEERANAEQRAKDLLLDLIGEKELAVYNETGRLFVKGKKFDYIIQKSGYIKQISKKKITDLCVHLDNRYKFPATDNVVAMKLAIESDEDNILKLANNWGSVTRPKELLKAACM